LGRLLLDVPHFYKKFTMSHEEDLTWPDRGD